MSDDFVRVQLTIFAAEDMELFTVLSGAKSANDRIRRIRGLLRTGLAAERGVFSASERPASTPKHKPPPASDDGLSDLDPSKFQFTKDF